MIDKNMKREFFIILSLLLFLVMIMVSCSFITSEFVTPNNQSHQKTEEIAKEDVNDQSQEMEESEPEPEPEPTSYQFIGLVDGFGTKEPEESSENLKVAENEEEEGVIPEITIYAHDVDMEAVARHYGFVPVFISDGRIRGRYLNGSVAEIDPGSLSQFAERGRMVQHPTASMRSAINIVNEVYNSSVSMIYLVPNRVEEYFIQTQMEAIRAKGIRPSEVAVVYARYRSDFSVEVMDVVVR